ncbi:hypothetical protein I3842_05G178300 [Carya illinoinensis]|uniref:Uncharacterized protein n=1 Tax=Carya illinoinensis TaxID=32201 RepID=A0A922F644_CARIL|nr:hypothetical protein I3842_05G178300 [Carya illinoinensis]
MGMLAYWPLFPQYSCLVCASSLLFVFFISFCQGATSHQKYHENNPTTPIPTAQQLPLFGYAKNRATHHNSTLNLNSLCQANLPQATQSNCKSMRIATSPQPSCILIVALNGCSINNLHARVYACPFVLLTYNAVTTFSTGLVAPPLASTVFVALNVSLHLEASTSAQPPTAPTSHHCAVSLTVFLTLCFSL